MSDTPRTDADDRNYPSPEYAQRIRFEGCDCVVMHPEEYESLYEKARQLERELNAAKADAESWREQAERFGQQLIDRNEQLNAANERIKRLEDELNCESVRKHMDDMCEKHFGFKLSQ